MGTVPVEIKQGKVTYSKIEMHDLAHRLENFDLVSSKIIFHSRFPLSRQFRLTRQTGFPMYRKKKKKTFVSVQSGRAFDSGLWDPRVQHIAMFPDARMEASSRA